MKHEDATIFALATAYGTSGVAIIRISGKKVLDAFKILSKKNTIVPRETLYSKIYDLDGDIIDEGVFIYFRAPRSLTGEDILEIHCHGSLAVIQKLLETLSKTKGLRQAEAGEFLRRGLENGKYDLSYAESINSLINSRTQGQRKGAIKALDGQGRQILLLQENLKEALAILEANIDFADEVDEKSMQIATLKIDSFLEASKGYIALESEKLEDGLKIAIVGKPNVGKSSLLNFLAKKQAAIVSSVAGTTRDLIEVGLSLDGFLVTLIDTAGLRQTKDKIENLGIKKAKNIQSTADLIIHVYDVKDVNTKIKTNKKTINVFNKKDKTKKLLSNTGNTFYISIKNNIGLEELTKEIKKRVGGFYKNFENKVLFNKRQRLELENAIISAQNYKVGLKNNKNIELMAQDIRISIEFLDRVLGKTSVDEEILGKIFSKFCIGK